jgi:hypothetical protein
VKDLIERLEKAAGPDRQLDNAIEEAVDFPKPTNPDDLPGYPPYFTASIDAALTLVPDGWRWQISNRAPKPKEGRAYLWNAEPHFAGIATRPNPNYRGEEDTAATPALALCIAALKARAAITAGDRRE